MTKARNVSIKYSLIILIIIAALFIPAAAFAESDSDSASVESTPTTEPASGNESESATTPSTSEPADDSTDSSSQFEADLTPDSDQDTSSPEAPASDYNDGPVEESSSDQSSKEQTEEDYIDNPQENSVDGESAQDSLDDKADQDDHSTNSDYPATDSSESALGTESDCYVVELDALDIANINTEIDLQFTFSEVGDSNIGEIDITIPDGFTYVENSILINALYDTDWIGTYNNVNHTVNVSQNSGVNAIFSADDPISILFSVITPVSASDGYEFTTSVKDADGNNNDMDDSSSQPVVNVRDGSAASPFEIGNANQLDDVRNYLDDKHFIQTADIDLGVGGWADGEGWEPLGDSTTKFSGSFDGDGYKISNLTVNRPLTQYQGLFGYTNGATIEQVNLQEVNVQGASNTGALAGRADSSYIEAINVTGQVNGGQYTGGLVGYLS
ncbi:MAG: ZmpA/ZmpB/ZmpC family metallo-endopeptidase-related protein, partial [Bacillota bacterium]|nr:ZmpA/ZmpB/ZmpC family metallo-endopeptidase-related protein [Bacillota bacterium]